MEIQNVSIRSRHVTLESAQALADAIGSTAATLIEIDRDDQLEGPDSPDRVIYHVKVTRNNRTPIAIDDLKALVDVLADAEQSAT